MANSTLRRRRLGDVIAAQEGLSFAPTFETPDGLSAIAARENPAVPEASPIAAASAIAAEDGDGATNNNDTEDIDGTMGNPDFGTAVDKDIEDFAGHVGLAMGLPTAPAIALAQAGYEAVTGKPISLLSVIGDLFGGNDDNDPMGGDFGAPPGSGTGAGRGTNADELGGLDPDGEQGGPDDASNDAAEADMGGVGVDADGNDAPGNFAMGGYVGGSAEDPQGYLKAALAEMAEDDARWGQADDGGNDYALGGQIEGPGGPYDDAIPVEMPNGAPGRLSDGEYVVDALTTQAVGPERLSAMQEAVHAAAGGPLAEPGVAPNNMADAPPVAGQRQPMIGDPKQMLEDPEPDRPGIGDIVAFMELDNKQDLDFIGRSDQPLGYNSSHERATPSGSLPQVELARDQWQDSTSIDLDSGVIHVAGGIDKNQYSGA